MRASGVSGNVNRRCLVVLLVVFIHRAVLTKGDAVSHIKKQILNTQHHVLQNHFDRSAVVIKRSAGVLADGELPRILFYTMVV
jgi:hypothetical protein